MSPLAVIFLIVFLDLLGAGILVPVFPFLVRQFQNDAMAVGLMSVAFSGAQFFATPILGVLSDRFGRRPVLLISLAGTAFGYFLFGWAGTLWLMYLSRVIDGVTGGNISTAQAYIADITPPEQRAKNFGLIGAAFGLGFIIGPALGGVLSKISLTAPAFGAGALSLVTLAATWFFLPESHPVEKRGVRITDWRQLDPLRQIGRALVRPELTLLLLAFFSANFAMAALQTNFAVYAFDTYQIGPAQIAGIFAAIGIVGVLTQGLLMRRISGVVDGRKLAVIGTAIAGAAFAGLPFIPSGPLLFIPCGFISFGMGLTGPSLTSLLSRVVSSQEQGSILGVSQSLGSLTRVLSPVAAGALYDHVSHTSPYYAGALCLLLALALVISSWASQGRKADSAGAD